MRRLLHMGLVAGCCLLSAPVADAAARLDYEGDGLSRRQVSAMAGDALRTPRDSLRRVELLHAIGVALENEAYLLAQATVEVAGEENATRLVVRVNAGQQFRVGKVQIATQGANDSTLFAAAIDIESGDLASPLRVGEALEHALRIVVDQGYAYARLGVSDWDSDSGRVAVTLTGALGPLVMITATLLSLR